MLRSTMVVIAVLASLAGMALDDDGDGFARPPSASACFPQSLGEPVCP